MCDARSNGDLCNTNDVLGLLSDNQRIRSEFAVSQSHTLPTRTTCNQSTNIYKKNQLLVTTNATRYSTAASVFPEKVQC